jgi:transposase
MNSKLREVLRLYEQGFSQRDIHRALGVARSCIQRYISQCKVCEITYEEAKNLSDDELRDRLGVNRTGRGRVGCEDADFEEVSEDLQSRKGVTLELLWEEWAQTVPSPYGYATFCRRYREWSSSSKVWMRQEYRGGEKCLVDYSGEVLNYSPQVGGSQRAEIFVGVLGASNYIFCEASPSQQVTDWQSSHVRMFEYFGGVPECVISDNLKSGVKVPDRFEPELNQNYLELADHYDTTILPARVRKPKDKAKVEQAVQQVGRKILAPLRKEPFRSISEINLGILPRLVALNRSIMRDYKLSRRELFERIDQPNLRPLPVCPFVPQRWFLARVSLDYHVQVEQHFYSVPCRLAKEEVRGRITQNLVEIFHNNERVCCHPRSYIPFAHTTCVEHMPRHHQFQKSLTSSKFVLWSEQVGPETTLLVERLLCSGRHREQGYRSILGLQRLEKKHGRRLLERAAAIANEKNYVSQRFVRQTIEHLLIDSPDEGPPLRHDNIRGSDYYH